MLIAIVMIAAIAAGVYGVRMEGYGSPETRAAWVRAGAYWLFTIPVAFEMAAGGVWDLSRIEYVRVILTHLGYPLYLLYIIGVPRIPCAFVLLLPRFPRLKEWAYAGAFFNYAGAAASHLLVRDHTSSWAGPLVLSAMTLASWALRPQGRKLPATTQVKEMRGLAWAVPILIGAAMLVVAFITLPQGPPPPQ